LTTGIVIDVYAIDRSDSDGNLLNLPGTYMTYTVQLSATGVLMKNVPALMTGGHYQYSNNTPNAVNFAYGGDIPYQNTEETPLIPGQPVLIGFINGSNQNPVIIGVAPCQLNATTASTTGAAPFPLDPQTAGNPMLLDPSTGRSSGANTYPQKQGIFQGTSWKIDKSGNPTMNIITGGKLKIEVNGVPFVTVDGTSNTVDIGTGVEPGVLGNTLNTYLTNFITTIFNLHTHASPISPPVPLGSAPAGITTSVLKVQ
jgi:hypothetical protein